MFKHFIISLCFIFSPLLAQSAVQQCNHNSCAEAPVFQTNLTPYTIHRADLPVYMSARTPSAFGISKYAIIAEIHFGSMSTRTVSGNTVTLTERAPDITLAYSKFGWIDPKNCGSLNYQITNNCGWSENEVMTPLVGELVFQELTLNTNLVISYIRTVNQELTHKGYLYQCTQFFSPQYPACFFLGK